VNISNLIDFDFIVRKEGETTRQGTFSEDGKVGPIFGADIVLGEYDGFKFNVEGAFVDGAEVTLALSQNF